MHLTLRCSSWELNRQFLQRDGERLTNIFKIFCLSTMLMFAAVELVSSFTEIKAVVHSAQPGVLHEQTQLTLNEKLCCTELFFVE